MVKTIDRHELLNWLGAGAPVEKLPAEGTKPRSGQLLLVRSVGHDRDRAVIIVADEAELSDFLAFVSTYVSTFSPFSRFFRVMTYADWAASRSSRLPNWALYRALTGAVICDAIPFSSDRSLDDVAVQDCLLSETFCMAKAFDSARLHDRSEVLERWVFCSRFLSHSNLQVSSTSLDFWRLLDASLAANRLKLSFAQQPISEILSTLLEVGEFGDRVWREVIEAYPFLSEIKEAMHGPRESRARAFSNFVRSDAATGLGTQGDFVVGMLGVLLAGAQVEYSPVIDGLRPIFPNAPKWFGFVAGSIAESDVLTAGRSLGRHIYSELTRAEEFGEEVKADISFEELRLAWGHKRGISSIRTKSPELISVALFPDLTVTFKCAENGGKQRLNSALTEEQFYEARRLSSRLNVLLNEAAHKRESTSEAYSRKKSQKKLF